MNDFTEKNIAYITSSYNNFQKDQIDNMAPHFKKVYVFVRFKSLYSIFSFLPINELKLHSKKYVIQLKLKPANVEVIPVGVFYLPFSFSYRHAGNKLFKKILKIIKKNNIKFDIVHGHHVWTGGYVANKLAAVLKVPSVITSHRYDISVLPFKSLHWKKVISRTLKEADALITVSKNNLQYIEKLINSDCNVNIIFNGYSRSLFHSMEKDILRKDFGLPADKKIFLTVAGYRPVKGHKYLINAVKEIEEKKDLLFVFIGNGPLKSRLGKLISKKKIQSSFLILDGVTHEKIGLWMNASDFFLLPSLHEGNPTVMFEALGCGMPFLGTMVGGIPEIITDSKFGYLCEPKSSSELKKIIIKAINNSWSKADILTYAERFDWNNICKSILNVYGKVLFP